MPMRQLGSLETEHIVDLVFDRESYRLCGYITKTKLYLWQNVELRGGVLLAGAQETVFYKRKEELLQQQPWIFYKELLQKKIYDEEGELLGIIGDIEVDLIGGKMKAVLLSGGILSDLLQGRKHLDVVHLKKMQKEWEETV